ncbi:AraC family transcriptional regulator [Chelatococcus asaccharovorans]|uniref:AraC family transcriptional regulator n=1 Tax=Chelatococcus asaccharovorans TaxID=28210 RepID=UPI00224C6464|nr:AraC family transcriptional regulator [Chelatococcus asaccharovorans]CAH1665158.1 hypothetical protein CHELA40_12639 [Chelatococcus asaccharovorans]CAH1682082.1 hypothetical protein CHELA17_62976 [Chelatococcus asaccharovorans]
MAEPYDAGTTVVLSDPADRLDERLSPAQTDRVTFWMDPSYDGLQAAAARFRNHCFRPHTHDGLMIGLIDAGSKSFMRERKQFVANPGAISVVNAGDLHTGSRAEGDELKYRALYIPLNLLANLSGSNNLDAPPGFQSGIIDDGQLFNALGAMHLSIVQCGSKLERDQLLLEALKLLVGRYGSDWRPADRGAAEAPNHVRDAYALIEAHYREELSISDISIALEISPYHLMREFRRHTGIPMHALQTQFRVELGKRLLRQGLPVAEVALAAGFADQSHFTKRFREIVGTPPAAYRRNLQGIGA